MRSPGEGVAGVGGEFVVATAEVLYERMARGDTGRRPELFQPAHRAQPSLQPAMISFNTIIGVLLGHVGRGRNQFVDHPQVRAGPVGGHLDRRRPLRQRSGEEPAGGRGVPLLGEHDVDDLPVLVDRPVQIPPPASDPHVGLIDEPPVTSTVMDDRSHESCRNRWPAPLLEGPAEGKGSQSRMFALRPDASVRTVLAVVVGGAGW